jgi:hypothetical protein
MYNTRHAERIIIADKYSASNLPQYLLDFARLIVFTIILVLGFQARSITAHAQASLLTEDTIDDIRIRVGTGATQREELVTVVRDAYQPVQWYYIPTQPHLYERDANGRIEPEFALVKYDYDNPVAGQPPLQGAILQFAVTLALSADQLDQVRQQIATRRNIPVGDIRLSAVPMKSAEVNVYTPGQTSPPGPSTFLQSAPNGTGLAPIFATQKMVFQIPLTAVGSNVFDALVTSGGSGVPVAVTFKFHGTTPPAGFKVKVNWRQAYRHYSSSSDFRVEASYWGLVGASYRRTSQEVFNDLVRSNSIEVELITGESFDLNEAHKYLQPILARINQQLLDIKPPPQITPAQAQLGQKGGFFGGGNYAVAFKSGADTLSGTEEISMKVRSIVERQTVASGFIGIQQYPQAVRDAAVFYAPIGFERPVFLLPQVGSSEELGIQEINMQIDAMGGSPERRLSRKNAKWTPGTSGGWRVDGSSSEAVSFGLGGFGLTPEQRRRVRFALDTRISFGPNKSPLMYQETVEPPPIGTTSVITPTDVVDLIEIDARQLKWRNVQSDGRLERIDVTITSGTRRATTSISPQLNDRVWSIPVKFVWMVKALPTPDPINVNLQFKLQGDPSTKSWASNGDLRAQSKPTRIILSDDDVPR